MFLYVYLSDIIYKIQDFQLKYALFLKMIMQKFKIVMQNDASFRRKEISRNQ